MVIQYLIFLLKIIISESQTGKVARMLAMQFVPPQILMVNFSSELAPMCNPLQILMVNFSSDLAPMCNLPQFLMVYFPSDFAKICNHAQKLFFKSISYYTTPDM